MTYYTNCNQIKELMTTLTNLEVKDLGAHFLSICFSLVCLKPQYGPISL